MIYPPPLGYAPPMAYPPPLIVCAQPAYYPSPNVTYIGGPGSCAPNYYAGGQGPCYGSPSVIYFGRLQAHREGYHFRHYR
jgi:hypothetical protein